MIARFRVWAAAGSRRALGAAAVWLLDRLAERSTAGALVGAVFALVGAHLSAPWPAVITQAVMWGLMLLAFITKEAA